MHNVKEKEVTLVHHKTGDKKTFVLRPFRCGDEDAVIECVSEEYGDTYYRREYYDKKLLLELALSGELYLFLAYCGDDVCGIQSIVSHAPETRLEAASQIFRKAYRGYGLPFELVKYTYEVARSLHPSCIYASMVIFHDITQKMCEDAGMVAVAFNFGSHLTSKMQNSFSLGSSEKYGQAIMILPVDKTDAGNIYIHPDIEGLVKRLYSNLGVSFNIITRPDEDGDKELPSQTDLDISVNDREQSISITVHALGMDLMQRIREVKSSHSGKYWTIQLILPVDKECALSAYEQLADEGFYFTGIRALCSDTEQIYMQYTGDVYFNFDEFKLTDSFKALLADILKYYKAVH